LVKNGNNGLIFKQGDKKDLAEKLQDAILNYAKLKHIRKNALMCASKYTWNKLALKLENLYKESIN
jgi:glycosyltransferase involved in cell wall biosynthesis